MTRLFTVVRWLPEILMSGQRTTHVLLALGERRGRFVLAALVLVRGLIFFGLLLIASRTAPNDIPLWFACFIGGTGIIWVTHPMLIARCYVHGFMDSRMDSLNRLRDASSPEEWLSGMKYHDAVHVLGLPIDVPDSPEGLDE